MLLYRQRAFAKGSEVMDDEQIIALFFERSEEAIYALELKYGRLCRTIARNILGDPADEEECLNDTWLAVWNAIPPEHPRSLVSYVCRIARNRAVTKHREASAMKRDNSYDIALDELGESLPARETVDSRVDAAALTEAINRFLEGRNKDERRIFLLRYWYSESIEEIAERCKLTKRQVSNKLYRLRLALREHLREEGYSL